MRAYQVFATAFGLLGVAPGASLAGGITPPPLANPPVVADLIRPPANPVNAPPVAQAPAPLARPVHLRMLWRGERGTADAPVRRTATQVPLDMPAIPGAEMPLVGNFATGPLEGGRPISLDAALYGAITSNPDLISLRNSNIASPEAVAAAWHFPTTLNPTLWIDVRPLVYAREPGRGMNQKDALMYFSWRQPIELGHQTTHRFGVARAALSQQQWTVVQAELLALVQTYRFFQTAEYRREKLRVARELAKFNEGLLTTLKGRLEANQVAASDVVLAEVENESTKQAVEAARQDYTIALTDLRNQIGQPENAGVAEPVGAFAMPHEIPPIDENQMIRIALQSRPDIHAARAAVAGACSALNLANADRRPTPIAGPVYERDQDGLQYFGFVYITPIPILNNGMPLVRQREADYRRALVTLQQAEQRATTQVKAAVAKWNAANRLAQSSVGLTEQLQVQVERMEKLFDANQTDLTKLLQARQRLLQLRNAELDAVWQATQAQADLLTALGAPALIAALNARDAADAAAAAPAAAPPAPAAPEATPPVSLAPASSAMPVRR